MISQLCGKLCSITITVQITFQEAVVKIQNGNQEVFLVLSEEPKKCLVSADGRIPKICDSVGPKQLRTRVSALEPNVYKEIMHSSAFGRGIRHYLSPVAIFFGDYGVSFATPVPGRQVKRTGSRINNQDMQTMFSMKFPCLVSNW